MRKTITGNGRVYRWLLGVSLLGLLGLMAPAKASADSYTSFTITGSFSNGATFDSGSTITIDTTTGLATASSIEIGSVPYIGTLDFSGVPNAQDTDTYYHWTTDYGNDDLSFSDSSTFIGFTGGTVSSDLVTFYYDGYSGTATLTDPPSAPEPSTILLLGAGLIGLLGASKLIRKPLLA